MFENIDFNRITNAAEKVIARHEYVMEIDRIYAESKNISAGDHWWWLSLSRIAFANFAFKSKMMAISGGCKPSSSSRAITIKPLDRSEIFDVKRLTDAINSYKVTIN